MNVQITLLALKASDPKTGWLDRQKFAELIVAKVLDEVAFRAYVSGDRAWSNDADRHWVELEFGLGRLAKMKNERTN
jgi:hypothetical protein